VEHCIHRPLDVHLVHDVDLDKLESRVVDERRHVATVTRGEVVEADHPIALGEQALAQV
jgi:hypothetical protein